MCTGYGLGEVIKRLIKLQVNCINFNLVPVYFCEINADMIVLNNDITRTIRRISKANNIVGQV